MRMLNVWLTVTQLFFGISIVFSVFLYYLLIIMLVFIWAIFIIIHFLKIIIGFLLCFFSVIFIKGLGLNLTLFELPNLFFTLVNSFRSTCTDFICFTQIQVE